MGKLLYFPQQTRTDKILDLCAYHNSGLREAIANTSPNCFVSRHSRAYRGRVMDTFYGYCYQPHIGWMPRATLDSPEQVWSYCNLHANFFPEVRVTDDGDFCIVHIVAGRIVFPTEKEGLTKEYIEAFAQVHGDTVKRFTDYKPQP